MMTKSIILRRSERLASPRFGYPDQDTLNLQECLDSVLMCLGHAENIQNMAMDHLESGHRCATSNTIVAMIQVNNDIDDARFLLERLANAIRGTDVSGGIARLERTND